MGWDGIIGQQSEELSSKLNGPILNRYLLNLTLDIHFFSCHRSTLGFGLITDYVVNCLTSQPRRRCIGKQNICQTMQHNHISIPYVSYTQHLNALLLN